MIDLSYALSVADYRQEIMDAPIEQQQLLLAALEPLCRPPNTPALNELAAWLSSLLETRQLETELEEKTKREVVSRRIEGATIYQLEMVRCGKGACRSCPHGPYWYGYRRELGKLKSWYVGKKEPPKECDSSGDRATHILAGELRDRPNCKPPKSADK